MTDGHPRHDRARDARTPWFAAFAAASALLVGILGALALLLTVASWAGWPRSGLTPRREQGAGSGHSPSRLAALILGYGLTAVGLVPHMLFVVDYVTRGLGRGLVEGGAFWVAFGVGASAGPLLAGRFADVLGFRRALRAGLVLQAFAVGLPLVMSDRVALLVSTVVAGAFTPGVVPLVLGRARELSPTPAAQQKFWAYATVAFAVAQAGAGYGLSYLFGAFGSYEMLFGVGLAAIGLAFSLDLAASASGRVASAG